MLPPDDTHGFVLVCVAPGQSKVAWTIDWWTFSSLFDTHTEYRGQHLDKPFLMMRDKEGGCWATGTQCIRNPAHFLAFPTKFMVMLQTSQRCESRSSLMCSLSLHLRLPSGWYMMVLSTSSQCQPTHQKRVPG